MMDSLLDDVARSTAVAVVEVFAYLLREEEKLLAVEEVERIVRAGLECLAMRKIKPSRN